MAWQMEQNLRCRCGQPVDEAWALYGPDRQREQEAEFRARLNRQLCTACKVSDEDEQRKREEGREAKDPLHGWHWTFDPPQ